MNYTDEERAQQKERIEETVREALRIKISLTSKGLPDNADAWKIAADLQRLRR